MASQEKQHEVKENENKNEMVNESLNEEELAKKTIALIDEYANIKDIKVGSNVLFVLLLLVNNNIAKNLL